MRPCAASDIDDLHRLWTDPQVRKYLWDDQIIPRELAEEVVGSSLASFASHNLGFLSVFFKDEEELIGFCGFRHFGDPPQVEILYGIAPAHWGKGLATEAARAVLRFGFEEIQLDHIYAGADPPNLSSFRVMERCGMKFDRQVTVNGLEAIYYALARQDFQPDDSPYRIISAPLG